MKNALRVAAGVILAAGFFLSALLLRRPPDPVFAGRYTSDWTADLLSPDYKTRTDAQTALQRLGASSVPQLEVLLRREDAPWNGLLQRLSSIVPSFHYTNYDAVLARERAAEMAGLLGVNGRAAIPDLIHLLGSEQVSSEAERALVRIGVDSVPALDAALHARKDEIRRRAAALLAEFATFDPPTVAALISALKDGSPLVRKEAASTLGRAASARETVTPALLNATRDAIPEVRATAYASLGTLGKKSETVDQALTRGITDLSPNVRLEAAKALWRLEADASAVVPALIRILPTREGWQAAYALAEIGPRAAAAVPALIKALRAERVPLAFRTPPSSAYALGQIGEAALPALQPVLADTNADIRVSAVLALGFMGKKAHPIIPALLPLLKDRSRDVRHAAALTLASAGAEPEKIVDALSDCLQADDIYLRFTAAEVLRKIAPNKQWMSSSE